MSVNAQSRRAAWIDGRPSIGYVPGLDGLRAIAVIAVIVYHGNGDWLPGGFLGVEVFFVLSGYLITRLLAQEFERSGSIDLGAFWRRRARRLLPALALTLLSVLVATALLRPDAAGEVRGDLAAAAGYVANWYQILVGAGYTAAGDFAPLRHLWSLAIEEQFYLVWPIVVMVLLRRGWSRTAIAVGAIAVTAASVVMVAALAPDGTIGDCVANPDGFWTIGNRCISIVDTLYLSSFARCSGLLLGAAYALLATHRRSRGWALAGDAFGATGMAVLVVMMMTVHFSATSVSSFLFRGGFVLVDVATLLLVAAVIRPETVTARALSARTMLWVGTRSYGLYLYHWPVFQLTRRTAGAPLDVAQFFVAVALSALLAEVSYRAVEMPIRRDGWRAFGRRVRSTVMPGRRWSPMVVMVVMAMLAVSIVRVGTAPTKANAIEASVAAGADDVVTIDQLLAGVAVPSSSTSTVPSSTGGRLPTVTSRLSPREPLGIPVTTSGPVPPPVTAPPVTAPPVTAPPVTAPPVTAPPVTAPPVTAPPVTAPPVTAPPDPTLPEIASGADALVRVPMLAIGDSVMLGAAGELTEQGWVVNAALSRQMIATVPLMQQLHDAGVFGDIVMVHLGTNGSISNETLDAALATLVDVPLVILVTIRADRSWAKGTSERIRDRAGGNVVVLDWATESRNCPGRCFEDDGIHLRGPGRTFYADLVARTLATAQS